ncbi:hypothetical protein DFP72DRAFT_1006126, partial [Ephemerocybe angulata]
MPSLEQGDCEEGEAGIDDEGSQLGECTTDTLEEDVGVRVDGITGTLVLRSDQVADYSLRGDRLAVLSLWEFVAQVDKILASSSDVDDNGNGSGDEDEMDWSYSDPGIASTREELLFDTHRFRPRAQFKETHLEFQTHCLRVRLPTKRYIPVPIGPAIPRRDTTNPEENERYSRLMLILFKPWRDAADLRKQGQSWVEAFDEFAQTCDLFSKSRMDNMQVLHECKDSRDDHFARRSKEKWCRGFAKDTGRQTTRDDFFGETDELSAILDHLEDIDRGADGRLQRTRANAEDCIAQAEQSGMFSGQTSSSNSLDTAMLGQSAHLIDEYHPDGLEDMWKSVYDDRRAGRKQLQTARNSASEVREEAPAHVSVVAAGPGFQSDTSNVRSDLSVPLLAQDLAPSHQESTSIENVVQQFTLNSEQARAFQIIANHALVRCPGHPLRMFLGGAGGTGKSRVIDALKEFFIQRGERERLRLASFTGVAARNISGSTLHSALNLVQRKSKAGSDKSKRDLIALWEGVDFLFVDEVSM